MFSPPEDALDAAVIVKCDASLHRQFGMTDLLDDCNCQCDMSYTTTLHRVIRRAESWSVAHR